MNDFSFMRYQQQTKPQMEYRKDNPELSSPAWLALRNASTADKAQAGYTRSCLSAGRNTSGMESTAGKDRII